LVHDFGVLSRVENARFWELYKTLAGEDEKATEAERVEFSDLLNRCPLVDPGEVGNPYVETDEERRERRLLERAFAVAFHDFAKRYIAMPNYGNMLNDYRLDIGYTLFEKYGWSAGERDCSGILSLDEWAPEDREALIDLYQRAKTSRFGRFPCGRKGGS
jgi:hypothetical protein